MSTPRAGSWVRRVQQTSDAMDLPRGLFSRDAAGIARGLRSSVLRSRRTKGTKFQSAMGMLNLYINRAGRKLAARDRTRLEAAKVELRKVFGRDPHPARRRAASARRHRDGRRMVAGRPAPRARRVSSR